MTRSTLPDSFEDACERYGLRANDTLIIRSLKMKRTERREQAQEIVTRAGGRKLTNAQEREFDRLLKERDELDDLVTIAEERRDGIRNSPFDDERGRGRQDAPELTFQTADGRTIRGVRHGESFAAAVHKPRAGRQGDGDGEDLSVGRALLGYLRGDHEIMERELRAQVVTNGPDGGFFVTDSLASMFIDKARSQSVISQAGAITVPLTGGETRILRVATDPTAAWKSEASGLNQTEIKFDAITMFPKVLGCVAEISEELIQDGANAADVIQTTLAAAVANQLDRSFWRGISNGSGDNDVAGRYFTGVLDDPDVNTVDMAGAAPTDYDEWIDAIQLVEDANGMADVRIDSPRTAGQLAKLKELTTGAYLKAPDAVAALRHLRTTQTPVTLGSGNDESVSVVGNFSTAYVILGMRTQFTIQTSNQAGSAFDNLTRKVRIWGRADMAIGRPSHLTLVQAIGPTA